jgi:hypothetical protein
MGMQRSVPEWMIRQSWGRQTVRQAASCLRYEKVGSDRDTNQISS